MFTIYAQIEFEVETKDEVEAREKAKEKFGEIEKLGVKVSGAKVADRLTGYFV